MKEVHVSCYWSLCFFMLIIACLMKYKVNILLLCREQFREQLATAEALERGLPMAIAGVRPGSSSARYVMRPNSVKPQEARLNSARLRTAAGRGRLAPLERAKTPSMVPTV